jgi:fatty acid synthase
MKIMTYLFPRFIGSGKHIGKVVLKIRDEEPEKVVKPTVKLVSAIPRTYMNPDKSYILVGKWNNKCKLKRL